MRIAQIGVGGWGKNHARVLASMNALAAVCDADPQRAGGFGSKYGVNHYTSVDDLLGREEFDAAVVATPTSTHASIATSLLEAGKHILVEKPLTYDIAEGRRLRDYAEKRGVILTCGYIERFNPAVEAVRQMASRGRYGELLQLEFHRENRIPRHIKDVGIILDTAVHDIDTANYLLGEMPGVVFARAGSVVHALEDYASIMLGYPGHRTAIISCNWLSPHRVRMFRAVFADAVVTGDFVRQTVDVNGQPTECPRQEPLFEELRSFLDAVSGGAEPRVTPHQALCVSQIADAAILSSQQGAPIYMDLR